MALPTYDRLCDASGATNNVALVALCAGVSGFIGPGPQGHLELLKGALKPSFGLF